MLDSAGRLQVPKEVRERYGIGDRVRMEETAEGLLLRPVAGAEAPVKRLAEPDEKPPPNKKARGLGLHPRIHCAESESATSDE